jgi:dTDP-glucose 4,6-dehydratase
MDILITGGAGFIGSHFVRMLCTGALKSPESKNRITIVDSLAYSGRYDNIEKYVDGIKVIFFKQDINNIFKIKNLPKKYDVIFNFAAQTHVDNSIIAPNQFVQSNIVGMHNLLFFAKENSIGTFVQISTDEVYGSIENGSATEEFNLNPSSPYSASKASADLLALSYFRTFNLDIRITRCTNNYGIKQYPEKIIPFFIKKILEGKNLPVYGSGLQERDWIHVDDHCRGIWQTFLNGSAGNVYNFSGKNQLKNIELAQKIIQICNSKVKIEFVKDRKGHDFRYSVNDDKARSELHFSSQVNFEIELQNTVKWYLENQDWIANKSRRKWYSR